MRRDKNRSGARHGTNKIAPHGRPLLHIAGCTLIQPEAQMNVAGNRYLDCLNAAACVEGLMASPECIAGPSCWTRRFRA